MVFTDPQTYRHSELEYLRENSIVCHTAGPQPIPKRVLHRVRSSAFSFNFQYPLFSLRLPSSCLRLLPRLLVTSILPSTFPSTKCFTRQFLRQMWPTQLAFFLFTVRMIFLSSLPLSQCFSTTGPRPGTGPWHQLYRAARGLRRLQYATRFH